VAEESVPQMLARAIQLVRERRKEEGREILLRVIALDESNEQAWLWLSGVVDDPLDMQVALANALTINPGNEQARRGLEMLRQRYGDLLAEAVTPAPASAPPVNEEEELFTFNCYNCQTELEVCILADGTYVGADSCFGCRAVVHCCENCSKKRDLECKEREGIRGGAAIKTRNRCREWHP
jgi:hypothetical protein